ncbi:MAG: hypothetical protein HJJLKODD_02731 [Phycisphaerae bacterium]|nr:hypothetical protein [Phycisphaerae bacterium]
MVQPEIRYWALGDSITGSADQLTYPRYLAAELDWPDEEFSVDGVGGRTVAEGFQQLDSVVAAEIYPNLELLIYYLGGADMVGFVAQRDPGLAISLNDPEYPYTQEWQNLLADLTEEMTATITRAQQNGWVVLMVNYAPIPEGLEDCPAFGGNQLNSEEAARANEYVAALNQLIAEVAEQTHASLADLRMDQEEFLSDLDHYRDCTHPNDEGAQIIARRIVESLAP